MHNPGLIEGVVVDTADPQEMGRMKVWCPAIDGDNPDIDNLPWVTYISPLAGQAHGYPAGNGNGKATGPVSYGFWAVPKCGALVLIGFLYNDYNQRIYMGSFFRDHGNRSLPVGRNVTAGAPQSDSYDPIEPAQTNLKAQFGGDLGNSIAQTRGAYERQAAQAKDDKDTSEGYEKRVVPAGDKGAGDLDPQTYCITTPGRHSIIMQDHPKSSRLRIKTAEGHQVIFDDANERIYVSTSRGNTWIELDVDGHIHVYGSKSISVSSGGDLNLSALGNVSIAAGGNLNLNASGYARVSACSDVSLSADGPMNFTSAAALNVNAGAMITATGSEIHLNGPTAEIAPCAEKPSIVPSHEPWPRPASEAARNQNWKA